jgi:hypothetical protein
MGFALQKQLREELNTRIPRGPKGSSQNMLRSAFWFFRSQGHPFDTSLAKALEITQERHPAFVPKIITA